MVGSGATLAGSAAILAASALACRTQALPTGITSIPATLIQLFELLFGVGKMGVSGFQDFGRGG
jgi:hypothetical protein